MRRHVAAVSSSRRPPAALTGRPSGSGAVRMDTTPTQIHPRKVDPRLDSYRSRFGGDLRCLPSGGTFRKVSGRLRKVTDTVTIDAPLLGQVGPWIRRTSPLPGQHSVRPINPPAVETAHRQWQTVQPGHAGEHRQWAVRARCTDSQRDPPVADGAPCRPRLGCQALIVQCHSSRHLQEGHRAAH